MRIFTAVALLLLSGVLIAKPLTPPKSGPIKVAVVLSDMATMIDFAGPWEVFQDVDHDPGFELYTVSDSRKPFRTTGGMQVMADYTFDDAPQPNIVVIGAQGGNSPKMLQWLRDQRSRADVVMSVCTGAFKLGAAGLLDGKAATTHHDFYAPFSQRFPKVKLVKSARFVQSDDVVFTAGGLTSGIDLALHIVERYFGRETAQQTANYMEYQSEGWKHEPAVASKQ